MRTGEWSADGEMKETKNKTIWMWVMKHKKTVALCEGLVILIVVPFVVYGLSEVSLLPVTGGNDWVGFWGTYIGSIVGGAIGGIVAMYVLVRTIEDNKRGRRKEEVIEFCNYLVSTSVRFAQKFEESLYASLPYLEFHAAKGEAKTEFELYTKFFSAQHSAKALITELLQNLEIRKSIEVYLTPRFDELLRKTEIVQEKYRKFETEVGKAEKAEDLNLKEMDKLLDDFMYILNDYEKQLLETIAE